MPAAVSPSLPAGNGPASTDYQPPRQGDWVARLGTLHFQAGTELRRFIDVPEGASWAEMSIKAGAHDTPRCVHSQLAVLWTYSPCVLT